MDARDELIGRIRTPGVVWSENPDANEAAQLRERARAFLDGQGQLSPRERDRMIALLFLGRV